MSEKNKNQHNNKIRQAEDMTHLKPFTLFRDLNERRAEKWVSARFFQIRGQYGDICADIVTEPRRESVVQ